MRLSVLTLFIAVYAISGFVGGIVSVVAPYIYEASSIRFSEYGLASFLSMSIAAAILVYLAKLRSRLLALVAGMVLAASWVLMSTLVKHLVLVARFLSYISFEIVNIIVIESIFRTVEKYRATVLGFLNTLSFAISLASPPLAVLFMRFLPLNQVALLVAMLYALLLVIVPRIAIDTESRTGLPLRELCHRHKHACLFVLITSLAAFPSSMYVLFDKIIGVYIGGFQPWVLGLYDALESALIAVLMPVGGYIVDRLAQRKWVVPAICDSLNIPYAMCIVYGAMLRNPIAYVLATVPDALLASFSQASIALLGDFRAPTKQLIALNQGISEVVAAISILLSGLVLDVGGPVELLTIVTSLSIIFVVVDLTAVKKLYFKAIEQAGSG